MLCGALLMACEPAAPSSSNQAAVPWLDRPGPEPPVTTPAAGAHPCRAADLHVGVGAGGAYRSQVTQAVDLGDAGADACFLSGAPRVLLSGTDEVSAGSFATERLDLVPGQTALLLIGAPSTCAGAGQPRIASTLRLVLPDGEAVSAGGARVDTECGPASVVRFEALAPPAPSPGPLSGIRLSISVPQSVGRGQLLAHTVTLRNPGRDQLAFSPCPSYTETLGTGVGPSLTRTLLLNCGAAGSLAGGASRAYEMRVAVPSSFPAGATKLSWKLDVANGPVVGTPLTVS